MLHLLLWAAYRDTSACLKTAIDESRYTRIMDRNSAFFKYLGKEKGTPAFHDAVMKDFQTNNHGVLIAFVNLCFQQWPALANLNSREKGILIVAIKSFVECFEKRINSLPFPNLLELVGAFRKILTIVGFFPIVWQKVGQVQIIVAIVQCNFGKHIGQPFTGVHITGFTASQK